MNSRNPESYHGSTVSFGGMSRPAPGLAPLEQESECVALDSDSDNAQLNAENGRDPASDSEEVFNFSDDDLGGEDNAPAAAPARPSRPSRGKSSLGDDANVSAVSHSNKPEQGAPGIVIIDDEDEAVDADVNGPDLVAPPPQPAAEVASARTRNRPGRARAEGAEGNPRAARGQRLGGGVPGIASMWSESTVWVGNISFVERSDQSAQVTWTQLALLWIPD